jgi:hypothetical protein
MALPLVLTGAIPPLLSDKTGMFLLVSFTLSSPPVAPASYPSPAAKINLSLILSYVPPNSILGSVELKLI